MSTRAVDSEGARCSPALFVVAGGAEVVSVKLIGCWSGMRAKLARPAAASGEGGGEEHSQSRPWRSEREGAWQRQARQLML